MVGTLAFLRETFTRFNREIFFDKLPVPTFKMSNARTFLGKFQHKKQPYSKGILNEFVIILSNAFDLPQQVLEDTIIHEMIHYEIAFDRIKDTSPHGYVFLSKMDMINTVYRRHLTVSNSLSNTGGTCLKPKSQRNPECIVAVLELKTGEKYFKVMPLTVNSYSAFREKVKAAPSVAAVSYYATFSEFFRKYPRSTSLKVYEMRDEVEKELEKATFMKRIEK